jgi:hypothetical protein
VILAMKNYITDVPIKGREVLDFCNGVYMPFHKNVYFVASYGCFQFTLLNSRIRSNDNGKPFVHAKFHVIFQDCLNIKQNYSDLSKLFDMKLINTKKDKILEKVFYINGYYDNELTYKEMTTFIDLIFRIHICKYCSKLYITIDDLMLALCKNCETLNTNAIKIQNAYRLAHDNPNYHMCKTRLLKEFDELTAETY